MSKRVRISDLKFDPENARVRTAKGEAMIQESLRQVGAARSIVIDEDGTILAGNGTVEAAGQIGIDNVVIVEASGDEIIAVRRKGLTDEQKKKLAYYDNRTGDEAEWDMEQVARDLLGGYEFLDELFDNIEVPAPETEGTDELPEDPAEVLREKWGVEYGDLWQMGPHRILCGDSTKKEDVDRLLDGAMIGLVLTDPPYGQDQPGVTNDEAERHEGIIKGCVEALPVENTLVIAFSSPRTFPVYLDAVRDAGHKWERMLWMYKAAQMTYPWRRWILKSESICVSSVGTPHWLDIKPYAHDCYYKSEVSGELPAGWHGSVKPLDVVQDLMLSASGDVYDPFVGSGTTLVAAHNEGRTCYAMEIDPAYVAVCIERMAQLGYDPDKVEKLES